MDNLGERSRDLAGLVVARVGRLLETGDAWEPYRLVDVEGNAVVPVAEFLKDLQGPGRSAATLRSYGNDLLRWFRFLWALDIVWDRASRVEARDFCRWMQRADKSQARAGRRSVAVGAVNPVTGKAAPGSTYAPASRAHCETVVRSFYDFHRDMASGPVLNPFPLVRERSRSRANEHHNPMEPFRGDRSGLYRPRLVKRIPRSISDEHFNELFAALSCHRDRALVALWVSTGARAAELLGLLQNDVDAGAQLVTVTRKGGARQGLPASPDAFVWLRLYQHQCLGRIPRGAREPLWWTLRPPLRPLTYHAARAALNRAQSMLGSNWSLHDFRHTAAYRMAHDPQLSLTDVQWVLGHSRLSTTQVYLTPHQDEVIDQVRRHHQRMGAVNERHATVLPAPGYRPEVLATLLGGVMT